MVGRSKVLEIPGAGQMNSDALLAAVETALGRPLVQLDDELVNGYSFENETTAEAFKAAWDEIPKYKGSIFHVSDLDASLHIGSCLYFFVASDGVRLIADNDSELSLDFAGVDDLRFDILNNNDIYMPWYGVNDEQGILMCSAEEVSTDIAYNEVAEIFRSAGVNLAGPVYCSLGQSNLVVKPAFV